MSTKSENAEIAVLQSQMDEVKSDLSEVKHDVKKLLANWDMAPNQFITRTEFEIFKGKNWVTHTLSAIAGGVLVGLVSLLVYFIFYHVSGVKA